MVLVMTILAALLAGGAVALFLQVSDTRSTAMIRSTRASLFCAEAGLAAARIELGNRYSDWAIAMDSDATNNPAWYPIYGDIDGDGQNDYEVVIRDNDDEFPPLPNNRDRDNDLQIFVVSRCIKYPETPREIMELMKYAGAARVYRNQSGQGSGNTGNAN